ncbi:dihydrofolate reductase family protein [Nocardioides sp.]|uniref:dihydrofolate reductase family protein n=1 Tax=Nocardioides sp. TaxID=35761 RepID=UPI002B2653B0|nr:dihydrofolate reductase family protein [Nocardioides sp.]
MQMIFSHPDRATGHAPGSDLSDDDVRDAYPWPADERWVRAMMVTTLDGAAAGPDGLSGSISSSVDKAVFNAVRRLAAAVLVGAGTVRAEGYGPMRAKPEDADVRTAAGLAPAPVLAIVTGSLDLDFDGKLFTDSTMRPLIITGAEPDPDRAAAARKHCDLVVTAEERPSAATVLDVLEQRGLLRIVCEGGPTLLESLVADDLLDEADITVSPTFAGTAETPRTSGLESVASLELAHVLHAESFLMCRYLRPDESGASA